MKPSSFIQRLTRKNSNGSVERAKPRSLRVESLESRELLSVSTAELSVVDANNDRLGLPLDVCVAPSFHESTPALVESSANSERPTCLENTEAELIIADLRAFDATVDELLTTAGQNINNLSEEFIFSLNSRPGSDYTIYLDFNGNEYKGSEWNGGQKVTTPPYDSQHYPYDGDAVVPYDNYKDDPAFSEFTNSELRDIYEIWYRVSEDFSPFDVNVTTQEPANDQFADNTRAIRVAIGGTCYDWYKTSGQTAAGGVANTRFSDNTSAPCYVFPWQLYAIDDSNNDQKYIFPKFVADTVSHEIGHTLGLNHDGTCAHDGIAAETYYEGADNWAPLMGNAWYQDLTQWSKSEYQYANNNQDELDIITTSNGFGYRDDDHGDTIATATPLSFDNSGALVYNAPGELVSGIIERNTDVDFFSFNLNGEKTVIKIGGVRSATNLDVLVNLYKANGELVEPVKTYDPLDTFYVAIDTKDLPSGKYYLGVSGTGRTVDGVVHYTDYGSLGAYTITTDAFFDAYEPNYSASVAYNLGLISGEKTFGNAYVGGSADLFDWYLFTIGSNATSNNYVKVNYTYVPNSHWIHLRLYKYDNGWTEVATSHNTDNNNFEIVSLDNLPAGTYRIRIANWGVDGRPSQDELFPYTLTINAPEVTLSTDAPTIGETITTSVSPEDAYVRYQWYRTSSNPVTTVTTPIKGATECSYMPTADDAGCYLTVKAFGINCYEETFSATTGESVWGIAVTLTGEDTEHTYNFDESIGNSNAEVTTNDFDENGNLNSISLREAYDYVNCYFVGDSVDKLNNLRYWRRVENENNLSYNETTGQYYYIDTDNNCYKVFKTITFAQDARNISLKSELETTKSFTIKSDVEGVSISPDQNSNSRIFNVTSGTINAYNLTLKNGNAVQRDVPENFEGDEGQFGGNGGAIYVGANGTYVANDGAFYNNAATSNGGAVYVAAGGTFTVNNGVAFGGTIEENGATTRLGNTAVAGGAVWNKGTFNANSATFSENVASYRGGAIANGGTVNITGATTFENNLAKSSYDATTSSDARKGTFGGAIYNNGANASVTIGSQTSTSQKTKFVGNQATGEGYLAVSGEVLSGYSGGAIYNSKGSITAYNVEFDENFAGKYGGAVSNFGTFDATNATFEHNVASAGGAVQNSGTATFTGTTFTGNAALKSRYAIADGSDYGGNGGAIFASGLGKSVTIEGKATFDGNQAANAGGAIDFISGALVFERSESNKFEFKNNVAGTIGGAIIVAGTVDFNDGTDSSSFDFNANENSSVKNSVGVITSYLPVNTRFHRTVETVQDGESPVHMVHYAPNVAITGDVGDDETIKKIAESFFGTGVLQNGKLRGNLVDTFTRYAMVTTGTVNFEALASSFSSTPEIIKYTVDEETEVQELLSGGAISLSQGSHTITYWDSQQSDVRFVANIFVVDSNTSVKVNVNVFDLNDRSYVYNGLHAVGVSAQVYSSTNTPVQKWKFYWDYGISTTCETFNNFGFACNAYHAYESDGTHVLKIEAIKEDETSVSYEVTIAIPIPTSSTQDSSAILDSESNFFSDLDLVDELFED